jgi:hypothetical protein
VEDGVEGWEVRLGLVNVRSLLWECMLNMYCIAASIWAAFRAWVCDSIEKNRYLHSGIDIPFPSGL